MRYFALLYTPEDRREILTALFVIDAEIRESAQSPNHDVAHTRLRWWRTEVDRLVNGDPQHPAAHLLLRDHRGPRAALAQLHELLVAADMDVARMTYINARELRAYCARSGGALAELIAAELITENAMDDATRAVATTIGIGVRKAEIVRDLRQDAHDGRVYLPLDDLEKHSVGPDELNARSYDANVRAALREIKDAAQRDLTARVANDAAHDAIRPLRILAALHHRLLERIAARNYDVASERTELGPIEKPWVAWREARRRAR
jgi:phytoene synthase